MSERVALLGGKFDGLTVNVSKTPARMVVGGTLYARIDDPDTGEFLGGYVHPACDPTTPRTGPGTNPPGSWLARSSPAPSR